MVVRFLSRFYYVFYCKHMRSKRFWHIRLSYHVVSKERFWAVWSG